ncbi:hypothetical protein CPB97_010633 [Podila verticillata]|nr:hypothetical protein CPB97_010633 [Podila verticillata]
MSDNTLLFAVVGVAVFFIALLFCHAYEISNSYIYYPLACFVGYKLSMSVINYFAPTAWDAAPPPPPKNRQEKKKFAKEAEQQAKKAEKLTRKQADAERKLAEARERD